MSNFTIMTESPDVLGQAPGAPSGPTVPERPSRWRFLTDPASLIPTYAGVVIALVGFALIGYCWAKVAGLVDVWRQMPYVVSAGLPGLGLVMTGLIVINVSARRQDGAARARQLATLTDALRELQRTIDQQ